jgi:hypothetical protein
MFSISLRRSGANLFSQAPLVRPKTTSRALAL